MSFDVFGLDTGEDEGLLHDSTGGDPVNIIIAIDEDFLVLLDGLLDARDGFIHIVKSKWVDGVFVLRMQKLIGQVTFFD